MFYVLWIKEVVLEGFLTLPLPFLKEDGSAEILILVGEDLAICLHQFYGLFKLSSFGVLSSLFFRDDLIKQAPELPCIDLRKYGGA